MVVDDEMNARAHFNVKRCVIKSLCSHESTIIFFCLLSKLMNVSFIRQDPFRPEPGLTSCIICGGKCFVDGRAFCRAGMSIVIVTSITIESDACLCSSVSDQLELIRACGQTGYSVILVREVT